MAVFFHVSDVTVVSDAAFLEMNRTNSIFFLVTDILPASFVNDVCDIDDRCGKELSVDQKSYTFSSEHSGDLNSGPHAHRNQLLPNKIFHQASILNALF